MIRNYLLLFLLLISVSNYALAQTVSANISWDFTDPFPDGAIPAIPGNDIPNLLEGNIIGSEGITLISSPNELAAIGWTEGNQTDAFTDTNAKNDPDWFTVTLNPDPGWALKIGTINGTLFSGTDGPTDYAIYIVANPGTQAENVTVVQQSTGLTRGSSISFNATADLSFGLGEIVELRIVAWGGASGNQASKRLGLSAFFLTNSVLPITLKSFTATPERQTVSLDWLTADETDNDFYAIERSVDGRDFKTIGRVEGKGTTELETSYTFIDEAPLSGRSYYRLKQVDFDGTTEYYGPIAVDRSGGDVDPVRVYPNPIAGEFITIEGEIDLGTRATLLDLTGRALRNWELGEKQLRRQLPVNGIAAGTYILRLEAGNTVRTVRFVRQ